ncbi:thrombopoietin isoform X3 [Dunckerocampus dactyliophorus]|uniref:thrombopoietin isoform X3 n=1 Tax=Dunckerocampus dactyliophorus TaxID=161453 RepID=UPI002404DFE7|nr:thrombopoietin isoform X3 [Dunckerocampus dactyliophorus]
MALSRFLLLCMLASEVWDAGTKPIDFVCSRSARRAMNIVSEIQTAMHQERRQDISASLRLLMEGVKVARHPSQAECSLVLLQRLEHNINSYLLILTHLQLSVRSCQGDTLWEESTSRPAGINGEHRIVLCSRKQPQFEHGPAELQPPDHRKTGAVDD